MKQNKLDNMLYAFLILAFATLACEFSISTAEITNVYMSKDENGTSPTTEFSDSDIFYCIVETNLAPSDTMVKVEWYAVNVDYDEIDPNSLLDSYEIEGSGPFVFSYENTNYLWPSGLYRVDIYLNGEFNTSVNFSVSE